MNHDIQKRLQEYYEYQEELINKEKEEAKKLDLLKRGLYTTVTSKKYQKGYRFNLKKKVYEKKVPLEISDEAYEAVKKYKLSKHMRPNPTQYLLNGIGVVILFIAVVIGFLFVKNNLVLAFKIWGITFVVSIVYFGLAEIIKLLEEIKQQLKKD